MLPKTLVYYSRTGVSGNVGERFNGIPLDSYDGESPFVLMFPTWGSQRTGEYTPKPVKTFLKKNGGNLRGVIGIGNTNFGRDYCRGAREVAEGYGVPLVAEIDIVPTKTQKILMEELFC